MSKPPSPSLTRSPAARSAQRPAAVDPEERYGLAMESINFAAYDWDIAANTVFYAPVLRVMLGLSASELATPDDWLSRIHPDDLPHYRRALVQHLKGETPRFECELRYRTGSGTWRWARQNGIARRSPDGRAARLVGATGDITEARQRQRELMSAHVAGAYSGRSGGDDSGGNEERFALALEALNENLYDWDIVGGEVYFSSSLRAMLGDRKSVV